MDAISKVVVTVLLSAFAALSTHVLVSLVAVRTSGWSALARGYRFDGTTPTMALRADLNSVLGWSSWSGHNYGILRVSADSDALYLEVRLVFGHPPLRIPWREVRAQHGRMWFQPCVELIFDVDPRVRLRLREQRAHELATLSGGTFKVPRRAPARLRGPLQSKP